MSVSIQKDKILPIHSYRSGIRLKDLFTGKSISSIKKKIKVSLTCNWLPSRGVIELWDKMSKGGSQWDSIEVVPVGMEADYHVIINSPHEKSPLPPEKTIFFVMEPDFENPSKGTLEDSEGIIGDRWKWFTDSFRKNCMFFGVHSLFMNNNEWHLGSTYWELSKSFEGKKTKDKRISSIVSSLYNSEGHKNRIDFLKKLEEDEIVDIDIFGRDNERKFKNYKGSLPSHRKEDGLIPYKYTFNAENTSKKNYFTEKIIDAILTETLCFYWGCPNISDFIDPRAYILLDLKDLSGSVKKVKEAIRDGEWENRLPFIKKEKEKILNYYSFYPRIDGLISMNESLDFVLESGSVEEKEKISKLISDTGCRKKILSSRVKGRSVLRLNKNIEKIADHFVEKICIAFKKMEEKNAKTLILSRGLLSETKSHPVIETELRPLEMEMDLNKEVVISRSSGEGTFLLDTAVFEI